MNYSIGDIHICFDALPDKQRQIIDKPKVLTGLPWKGTWYIPGGNSYLARLIEDAGGDYIWKNESADESIPLDFETVFMKAQQADTWINPGAANRKADILSVDERLGDLPVYHSDKIYNNNAIQNDIGGNDYWESGIMQPDSILLDLVYIFHPELLPQHNLKYYKTINN